VGSVKEVLAIDAAMVRDAAQRIEPYVHRTPVMTSKSANEMAGARLYFKCENLQRTGSFKVRGAANRILSIPHSDLPRGVVAFSSGNHAQATALIARQVGAPATIVMPLDAPVSKVEATRAHRARIVTYDRFKEDREEVASSVLQSTGGTLVPPYDHPLIMAGQGTAALELMEDVPALDALVVCVGGGGWISGSAVIAKHLQPGIRVFGVEPERASDVHQSLHAGERITIPPPDTIADGLRTVAPGKRTFPVIQKYVEKILLVSEEQIREAMRFLMMRMKLVVEPSGAASVAAVLFQKLPPEIKSAGVLISGGNVDLDLLRTL
jgi:threonine dehydratase